MPASIFLRVSFLAGSPLIIKGGADVYLGALLGVCAGLLWAAQGAIMLSYPQEEDKGKYIAWFWMIFNLVNDSCPATPIPYLTITYTNLSNREVSSAP